MVLGYDSESDWTILKVTMPKNQANNTSSLDFLENHPYMFPILRYILEGFPNESKTHLELHFI